MAASELEAGPIVQMIFARRPEAAGPTPSGFALKKPPETRSTLPCFKFLLLARELDFALE